MLDHPVYQPSPNGMSAVTTEYVSRRPSGMSAVGASSMSAVTIGYVSRQSTADVPFKVGYSGGLYEGGLSLSGLLLQVGSIAPLAASCAAGRRGLVFGEVVYFNSKNKSFRSLRP